MIRHRDKGKKQDLLKAIHFIEMIMERDYSEGKEKTKPNYWGILGRTTNKENV